MENSPLALFEHEKFGSLRVIEHKGEPWFVAKDVCECLEIGNSRDAVASLDDDEKGVGIIDTPGGKTGNVHRFRTRPVFPHSAFPQARSQGVQAVGDA